MKLNDPQHPWNRLTAAARHAINDRDASAPYGFATRIASLALAQERKVVSLVERFALRALGAACLLALLSVVMNYSVLGTQAPSSEDELLEDDPVAVLLDN